MIVLLCVLNLLPSLGETTRVSLFEPIPGLDIAFKIEPLGMLFALVASVLWIITTLYSIGYMRGNNEKNQTRFFAFFSLSIGAVMGLALSSNMFTLFLCYEALTFATYPLVTHKGNEAARKGGRIYLGILLFTSVCFLLLALCWTFIATGTTEFTVGGILEGRLSHVALGVLFCLYMFGIGKAGLMPFHRWLPNAMVAPTPVSALLHAVAVVKAGVFTVLKVTVYIFGIDLLDTSNASQIILYVASFTIIAASLIAMRQDNLKTRLAYSTIGQLAYVTLGAALATSAGIIGGALQIAMHAFGKITLFFCAGAIYTKTKKTHVSQLDGLGKLMPITFGAFFIASLSIIGLPPLGGSWTKWYLLLGSVESEYWFVMAVLLISSLLNIAYLLPIAIRGFLLPLPPESVQTKGSTEAPIACVIPLAVTALLSVALFFVAEPLFALLAPLIEGNP